MSYQVYRAMKVAESYLNDKENGIHEDYQDDKIFENIRMCFNGIYEVAKFHRELRFDLKGNWKLLKAHDYRCVLDNISDWLVAADDRYDGETWTEKC